MKHKSLIISVMIFVVSTLPLYGQITIVQEQARSAIYAIDPLNQCGIALDENGYFLFSTTSNMFDDAFILYLGPDLIGAQQTMQSLIEMVDLVKMQHITFQDFQGGTFTASMIYKGLTLSSNEYAGEVYLASSLLQWLKSQLSNRNDGPWNSINDALHAYGGPIRVGDVIYRWGPAYYLAFPANNLIVYLGNSLEDAITTMEEYVSFTSSKDQVWPIIILDSHISARVSNAVELGAKTSYVIPSNGRSKAPLYLLHMKRYVQILKRSSW